MKNSEKTELKRDIRELAQKGYSQKEAIKVLKEYGYCESTARSYWKVFSERYRLKCSYPKCNKVAEVKLGMNDPDAEMIPYCKECAEKVRMNTFMAIAKSKTQGGQEWPLV